MLIWIKSPSITNYNYIITHLKTSSSDSILPHHPNDHIAYTTHTVIIQTYTREEKRHSVGKKKIDKIPKHFFW